MMKSVCVAMLSTAIAMTTFADVATVANENLAKVTPNTITYKADNGWLYSKNELQHLAKGELVNGKISEVAVAKKNQDPAPALLKFNSDLAELGIQLIVIPVPPKMAFYPDNSLEVGEAMAYLKPYLAELQSQGLNIIDLSDTYQTQLENNLYCQTDAHWSPAGIAVAVDEVAKKIDLKGSNEYTVKKQKATISGDLARALDSSSPQTEELELIEVTGETISSESPILVIGDSHTLIFSTGSDMLAENGGFCEQLASKLKMPVERIGVKGSAATAVRINLFRNSAKDANWLKNKKYVIYLFSCREFTEATSGWTVVPVTK